MYRGCRAGHNVWQQLRASGFGRPLQRAATIASTTGKPKTPITKIITVTGQTRSFASEAKDDTSSALEAETEAKTEAKTEAETEAEEPQRSQDTAEVSSPSTPVLTPFGRELIDKKGLVREDGEPVGYGPKVIFSGIQPSGKPHLGNYLGALRQWKHLQDTAHPKTKLFFCIVDMHAMTTPHNRGEMQELRWDMMASLLALGLDPDRCTIFFQSSVPQHAELQWILSCTASTGYLSRMTQWKSKLNLDDNATIESIKGKKTLKHGLFSYPVLQAADILLYGTTHVPVGDDQRQHLEFTRECVTNFNFTYKTKCLVAPETLLSPAHRVMSLTDPRKKMSKSDTVTKSRLHIHSSPKKISQRISGAVTDSRNEVTYDPELRPGVANLINILAGFDRQGRTPEALAEQMQGYKIAQLKEVVTQVLSDELAEVRERYKYYESNRDEMREISAQGTEKARQHAEKTMAKVRDAIGISD